MYMDDSINSDTNFLDLTGTPEEEKKVTNFGEGSGQKPLEVEPMKGTEKQELFTDIPIPGEMMEVQAEDVSPNLKDGFEAEMKVMIGKVLALESQQKEGGDHLLAKAAALQEKVSAYKEKLANTKEVYREWVNHALSCFSTTTKCSIHYKVQAYAPEWKWKLCRRFILSQFCF